MLRAARWPSAARSTRRTTLLREHGLDGHARRARCGRSACATRAPGCGWPRATSSARYAEALAAGALRAEQGRPNPALTPWRSTAALALAHLGRRDEAAALADAELALARALRRAASPIAVALHARAVAEADDAPRVALCERALTLAPDAGLERVRARLELGSALAYVGRRVEAREALRPALADADAAGAVLLAQRARRELVATGLRPRQAALEGAAALTPRQRQICELAAAARATARSRRSCSFGQDRRDPPRRGLPQARREHARGAGRRARRLG